MKKKTNRLKNVHYFLSSDVFSGIMLISAALLAMLLANMKATYDLYNSFLETPLELKIGILKITKSALAWINDALMTFFFILIGLEVKHEFLQGYLNNRYQAVFPIIAAIGGMIVPSLIYLSFNFHNSITRDGWAIPLATDIAFALGILVLLGNQVPVVLKFFLMTLAVIDDLGTVIIITLFYAKNISILSLGMSVIATVCLLILNLYNIKYISIYLLIGVSLWITVLQSGIHPTISGIIISSFIPLKEIQGRSPAKFLEFILRPWVNFLILPLFAFANAGISLQTVTVSTLTSNLVLGIITGLFIGKPLGINIFCWTALKLKIAVLPQGLTYRQIIIVSLLCGIGFTMSIFIATLAFNTNAPELILLAKLGTLIGSLLAATTGYITLKIKLSNQNRAL